MIPGNLADYRPATSEELMQDAASVLYEVPVEQVTAEQIKFVEERMFSDLWATYGVTPPKVIEKLRDPGLRGYLLRTKVVVTT